MSTTPLAKFLILATFIAAVALGAEKADKPAKQDKYDVLAVHKTKAIFKGWREHRCMGLTALCPDRCGDSGTMAIFAIDEYTLYEKRGEYGDDKQETFEFLAEDNMKKAKIPAELHAQIKTLKPGDKVVLEWEHRYMNRDGSRWPERPVTKLEKLP